MESLTGVAAVTKGVRNCEVVIQRGLLLWLQKGSSSEKDRRMRGNNSQTQHEKDPGMEHEN